MTLLGWHSQCSQMLQSAYEWVMKVGDLMLPHKLELIPVHQVNNQGYSDLAPHLQKAANFAMYFGVSRAAQSMPHLYISSLTTWSQNSTMSKMWKSQFLHGPSFKHTKGDQTVALSTLQQQGRSSLWHNSSCILLRSSLHFSVRTLVNINFSFIFPCVILVSP